MRGGAVALAAVLACRTMHAGINARRRQSSTRTTNTTQQQRTEKMPSKKARKRHVSQKVKTIGSRMAQPVANLRLNQLCSTDMNALWFVCVCACARELRRRRRRRARRGVLAAAAVISSTRTRPITNRTHLSCGYHRDRRPQRLARSPLRAAVQQVRLYILAAAARRARAQLAAARSALGRVGGRRDHVVVLCAATLDRIQGACGCA